MTQLRIYTPFWAFFGIFSMSIGVLCGVTLLLVSNKLNVSLLDEPLVLLLVVLVLGAVAFGLSVCCYLIALATSAIVDRTGITVRTYWGTRNTVSWNDVSSIQQDYGGLIVGSASQGKGFRINTIGVDSAAIHRYLCAKLFSYRGDVLLEKGEYDKAIQNCDEAIRLDPKDAEVFFYRRIAWLEMGEYDKVIQDCDAAIRLDPKNAPAFRCRAVARLRKKEYDTAIQDCDEGIRLDPKDAEAFFNRGVAWLGKGENDKVIQDCDEAIRLDPKYAEAFYNKACSFTLQGKTDLALDNLGKASRTGLSGLREYETGHRS